MIDKDEIRDSLEKKAVKYLKFKYQLIVSYLTNISFYLVLRSSTSANKIKEHPVISTLVDIKLILDRIEKEVEGKEEEKKKNKKKRQPKEKTIIAKMIEELERQVKEGRPEDNSAEISNKLLAEVHEEFSNDEGEEEIQEEFNNEEENEVKRDIKANGEDEIGEEVPLSSILSSKKKKNKSEKHVHISEEVQEYSDSDYEERFISLKSQNNKKSKKNKKEKKSEDFNEAKINEDDDEYDEEKKKNSLRFHASNINKTLNKLSGKKSTGDLDVPYKRKDKKEISEEVRKSRESADADIFDDTDDLDLNDGLDLNSNLRSNKRPREEEDNIDNDYVDDFDDEDLQYYEDVSNATKEKKRVKEENFRKIKQELLEESMIDENDLAPGEKRHINRTIEKNRGLTPHRKREKKNPRVKHRKNYEKAMIKLKSFRRVAYNKSDVGPYAGETTGIKTKLSRSVRFTN